MLAGLASLVLLTQHSPDVRLAEVAQAAATRAAGAFAEKKVLADEIGITILRIDRERKSVAHGAHRGEVAMYPASVVKLFWLAFAHRRMEDRKLRATPELNRALTDMIVESSNDATALVVDATTETTGGPELNARQLKAWMTRRQSANRWFASLGYPKLNACQKTWNEAPYGREKQGYGTNLAFRNSLSPDVCARLMADIMLDRIVTPARCAEMRALLKRAIAADGPADFQSRAFVGKVLPKGFQLHSKAGYTDEVRHDVAHVLTSDGREIVLAIFTKNHSDLPELIPAIAQDVLKSLGILAA